MHLGVVVAMPGEARSLTRRQLPCGQILRRDDHLSLVRGGVGAANACRAAQALVASGVDALLSWGCAGGLRAALVPGVVVIPPGVVTVEGRELPVDAELQAVLLEQLQTRVAVASGLLLACAAPLPDARSKREIQQRLGADAVDMESGAIAGVAEQHGLPFAAVRVVLDPLELSLPATALAGLRQDGSFDLWRGLGCLLRHPGDLPGLLRLAVYAQRAQRSLHCAAGALGALSGVR